MKERVKVSRWYAKPLVWVIVAVAICGALIAYGLKSHSLKQGEATCLEDLINPAACSGELEGKVGFEAFRADLEDHLAAAKGRDSVIDAGVYFRDLRFGPTFGINLDEPFLPMSLMKIPVMIAVLKTAETNPEMLDEVIHTPASFAANVQLMNPSETLAPDRDYTVRELLKYMVAYSDNKSLGILSDWLAEKAGDEAVRDVMVDLGIVRLQDTLPDLSVTPKSYAAILRILYNASYLNPEQSQYALELLTQTKFDKGLTYGIPDDVRVAHKFGVRDDPGVDVQLHDCGIVYHPGGPYVLCVMTRGSSYESQAYYIEDVARLVYDEMSRRMAEAEARVN